MNFVRDCRGAALVCVAACDIVVPRGTSGMSPRVRKFWLAGTGATHEWNDCTDIPAAEVSWCTVQLSAVHPRVGQR